MKMGLGLPKEYAFLTKEEVLAVRLYSGPAFQPINDFLRQLAHLKGAYRRMMSRHPQLTLAAIVANICHAIRKIASVATEEEATRPLYLGVRGVLPKGFWSPDMQNMISAADTAFMSTSLNGHTPIAYMGAGENVLWATSAGLETAEGFHYGADIPVTICGGTGGALPSLYPASGEAAPGEQAPFAPRVVGSGGRRR